MANLIKLQLDTIKNKYTTLELMQGYTYNFEFEIFSNGIATDLTSVNARIEMLKADEKFIIQTGNISISNNKISGKIASNFTQFNGKAKMQVILTKDTDIFGSWVIECKIKPSAINDNKGESENIVTIIEELKDKITQAQVVKNETQDLIEKGGAATKGDIQEITSQLDTKANKDDVAKISSGTPLFAPTTSEMTDTTKNYVNTTDGYLYTYSAGGWTKTNVLYQEMGIADRSILPIKLNANFDFMPLSFHFERRSTDGGFKFTTSNTRYCSNYELISNECRIICTNKGYKICLRLFDENGISLFDTPFSYEISTKYYRELYPTTKYYVIFIAKTNENGNATNDIIEENMNDFMSSIIYGKTSYYPLGEQQFEIYKKSVDDRNIKSLFNGGNFDINLLCCDNNGDIKLKSDISTNTFHKWMMYFKTDLQKGISSVKARFKATSYSSSERLFLESSDGRVVWFNILPTGFDCYSMNKVTGEFAKDVPYIGRVLDGYVYPQEGVYYDFEIRIVGKISYIYINGVLRIVYNMKNFLGDKINKCGVMYRGNSSQTSFLSSYEVSYIKNKFIHISVDDVFTVLKSVTEKANSLNSIFDYPEFSLLKDMHNQYGAVFSLYLFYSKTNVLDFDMSQVTTKFKQELEENSHWLKFGYHANDETLYSSELTDEKLKETINKLHNAIRSFAGENSIDKIPRFHYYSVNSSGLKELRKNNILLGVLTADDERVSNCGLDGLPLQVIQNYDSYYDVLNDISYFRTDCRFDSEDATTINNKLNTLYNNFENNKSFILFAHSISSDWITPICEWASKKNDVKFDFPMNNI